MKLDNTTLNVLKSFSLINPSIIVREGNVLLSPSPTKEILGRATVPASFDKKFSIYSVSRFLNTLSLFNDPSMEIDEKKIKITDGNSRRTVNYTLAEEAVLAIPKVNDPAFPEGEIKFKLKIDEIKEIEKALSILGGSSITVCNVNGKICIQCNDLKDPNSDVYNIEVGETNKEFKAIFDPTKFSVLSKNLTNEYDVDISSKGFAHFKTENLEYWIVLEASSILNSIA